MFAIFLAIISLAHLLIEPALGSPLVSSQRVKRDRMSLSDYLMGFGYIDKDAMSVSNLRSAEDLKKALKTLQKIGHIPETGTMDRATISLMSKPRCGMPDMPDGDRERRYVHADTKWDRKEISWNLGRTPGNLRRDDLRRDVQRALEVWAADSGLTFRELDGDPKADIQISFDYGSHGDKHAFDGKGMVLAHAFAPDKINEIGGDTHFDAEEDWTLEYQSDREGTHFFMVALHEFGHSLGLRHSDVVPSVMSPWYSGSDNSRLEQDDVVAIQFLYGINDEERGRGREPARERPNYQTQPPSYRPQARPDHPPQSRPDYPPQKRPDYPPQRRPDYPPKARPDYPPQRRPDYPPKARPDYPPQARPDYPPHARPDYPPQRRPDYPPQARPGYPPERRYPAQREPSGEQPDRQRPDFRAPNRPQPTTMPTYNTTTERLETTNPSSACDIAYDAVSILREELFIFKDDLFWRVRVPEFEESRNAPWSRKQLWKGMPDGNVDAVYERPNGEIVFFIGKYFYVYVGTRLKNGPVPLTNLGLPSMLKKIDAVTLWKKDTYLFSGRWYWKFNEDTGRVEHDYPKEIADSWKGLDGDIDAAMKWSDDHTYFFKGKHFGRFDDEQMRVEDMTKKSAPYWMNCKESAANANVIQTAFGYFFLPLVFHVYRYLATC